MSERTETYSEAFAEIRKSNDRIARLNAALAAAVEMRDEAKDYVDIGWDMGCGESDDLTKKIAAFDALCAATKGEEGEVSRLAALVEEQRAEIERLTNSDIGTYKDSWLAAVERFERAEEANVSLRTALEAAERREREAGEAIRNINSALLKIKVGEPRQALWDLLRFAEKWSTREPAVARALARRGAE